MKYTVKIVVALFVTSLTLSGCIKETEPKGSTATADQVANSPSALAGFVEGMNAWMITYNTMGQDKHYDFGYHTLNLLTESNGMDCFAISSPYDLIGGSYSIQSMDYDNVVPLFAWRFFYKLNALASEVIRLVDPENALEQAKWSLGQALTYRAFAYHHLVQIYQYRYIDHKTAPAVPIVTEKTTVEEAGNNPRATVEAIYTMIKTDLQNAIKYLEGYKRSGKKHYIDKQVAQALLARVCLTMEDWEGAAENSELALVGYSPLTEAQATNPITGFNDMYSQQSWIWGCDVTEDDFIAKNYFVNFAGWMCNDNAFGYNCFGGPMRLIDKSLYDKINDNDWRKKLWTKDPIITSIVDEIPAYGSLKFRPYKGDNNSVKQAGDLPLIRYEEMKLINIEAKAMGGNPSGAKTDLEAFVQTRQSDYTCSVSDAAGIRDEVWLQRRIELWGEGFSFFDLKRLNKGITRYYPGTNHTSGSRYNTTEVPYWFNWCIPLFEINSNKGIPQSQNNPAPAKPTDAGPLN